MKQAEEDIAKSLEINNLDLLDYLPYLLQDLFDNYLKSQENENYVLENKVNCALFVLKKL
ncbi:MAG: hypothetical protein KO464_11220 [Candidatus Methanofastidiosum sp.]|nr:hypothetical protein [Methanofastidiosum sp.]